jgi:mono/diheme cytochrome c family protein
MPYARPWLVSIGALAWSLVCAHAWTQDVGHSTAGLGLARQICSECHAIERPPARSPNPAAPGFETIANVPGMTGAALSVALQRSHVTMPNVILNADELSNIVAYILSLRRAN